MADVRPQTPHAYAVPAENKPEPAPDAGHIPLTEEMDKAKWTLPPLRVVGIVLLVIAVIVGIFAYANRPKPGGAGSIDDAYAVALPGDSVLATIKVTLQNTGGKPLWIRSIKGQLNTDQGEFKDDAANAVDFERYFQGFPDLRDHSIRPLIVETRIEPGAQERGSIIVSFPVRLDAFEHRKSLSVIIEPYDQRSFTITR
jgi:hypothetical protein